MATKPPSIWSSDKPNLQLVWDSTSLSYLKNCPREYYYRMVCGYKPKRESIHLKFGSYYHEALETYDRAKAKGADEAEAIREAIRTAHRLAHKLESDRPNKTKHTLVRAVSWYLDHFTNDPLETVQLADGSPAVELSFELALSETPYTLCGHIDRVVKYADKIYITDRKTTGSTISSSYFDQYTPDNQMSLYSFACQIILGTPASGIIIDAVQLGATFARFARGVVTRRQPQLEEWLQDTLVTLNANLQYIKQDRWPQNDKACHHYGGCAFCKVCSKLPSLRESVLKSDFVIEPWNPLEKRK